MQVFWTHELGWFTSHRDDLSDLGDMFLDAAIRILAQRREWAEFAAARLIPERAVSATAPPPQPSRQP